MRAVFSLSSVKCVRLRYSGVRLQPGRGIFKNKFPVSLLRKIIKMISFSSSIEQKIVKYLAKPFNFLFSISNSKGLDLT